MAYIGSQPIGVSVTGATLNGAETLNNKVLTTPVINNPTITGTLTTSNLPTVPTTKGGTGLTSIGTAGQLLMVNSGATALEFATSPSLSFTETLVTPTSGQTTFTTAYVADFIQVFVNGIKLIKGTDFTASDGTSVVLAASVGTTDIVEFVKFK
jgi:hypothetical protein